ncbi:MULTISPECIES: ABC transporter permease [Acetomicrobium]|jgi:peptide/nickel transport system permease protein|uniref:ABC transporter permease n=1 Tax=Acetomicrobium TaxID=49894 RepID=UPI00168DA9C4|nr:MULTISPECIES: ABC transporter permease [Acetomicrobium]MDI9376691.1 ABC transporter permease [Synergistota bacterium]NLI42168.1 ABC transporter permease [Synergistaceae bacterium]MDR9770497.1 ABC transporter permease [Acetomicrobium sp.]HOB10811.1 ABC transporter permease [Acetomicrobium sp.]HPT65311.1 ABC transporter permease [Acetomicrobium sp.]
MEKEKLLAHETLFADIIRAFKENKTALFGLIVVVILVVLAIFAPYVTPYDPYEIDLNNRFSKPSLNHWFGTDMFGRDLFTRVIYGARISLAIGLIPSLIAVSIGAILGVVSGYIGGRLGYWVMRMADVVMAFPSLLLAIVVMYTLGATLFNLFIALSVVGWAGAARVVRSQALSIREKEFIEAAKAIGVKDIKIMARHVFPNCLPSLMVLFTMNIPDAILSEASLSFLGVGAQPPTPSWGLLVSNGKEFLFSAPWVAILPGVAIFITVLAFNFIGDGLRDAIDPYLKG